ncbi:hypothetical protein U1701_14470 [Sphingomonas sp. PB2P19]
MRISLSSHRPTDDVTALIDALGRSTIVRDGVGPSTTIHEGNDRRALLLNGNLVLIEKCKPRFQHR